MSDPFSLVIFTIFGQCAAGMMIFLSFRRQNQPFYAWLACAILAIGALASLGHLGTPFKSYGSIANVCSSWLAREILTCLIFGASIIVYAIIKKRWACCLSAVLGFIFIYAMCRVYTIPTEPFWNNALTFWVFLSTGLALGAGMILLLTEMFPEGENTCAISKWSIVTMGAAALSSCCLSGQLALASANAAANLVTAIVLLTAGGGFGLMLLSLGAQRMSLACGPACAQASLTVKGAAIAVVCVIFLAEIIGRYAFYKSYVWFGM